MDCNKETTWLAFIECPSLACKVQPKAKYVPIRKKQKENPQIIREKVERCIKYWNDGLLDFKNEGFSLDYEQIVKSHLEGKLGLPGHEQK
jgi:hypothetical protein